MSQLTAIQTKNVFPARASCLIGIATSTLDCRSIMHENLWNKYITHVSQRGKAKTKSFAVNERIPEIVSLARAFCENTETVEMAFFSSFSFPSTQPNFFANLYSNSCTSCCTATVLCEENRFRFEATYSIGLYSLKWKQKLHVWVIAKSKIINNNSFEIVLVELERLQTQLTPTNSNNLN